jgi:GNAT superfamily N-acetyltransferase
MSTVEVRLRTSGDLNTIGKVLEQVYETSGYPVEGVPDPISFITPPNTLCAWTATISNRIVGHAMVTAAKSGDPTVIAWLKTGGRADQVAVLQRLFVDPSAKGNGIGKKLTVTATQWAASRSLRLTLLVLEKDRTAIRLYESLGWQRMGVTEYENAEGEKFKSYTYVSPASQGTA